MEGKKYSIVIPVYNSEKSLRELSDRIDKVFKQNEWKYEVIFVNDLSKDNSLEILKEICRENQNFKYISLRKNFGQHNAIMAGFNYVTGDYIITMDDDLQNPPEEIPKLIHEIHKTNHDIIFAEFEEKKHSFYRRLGSKLVKWLNEKVVGKPRNLVLSNFRIIKREIVEEVIKYRTNTPYLPALLLMVTHDCGNVLTRHEERLYGKSNYTLRRILKLIVALLFTRSNYALKLAVRVGLFFSIICLLYSGYIVIRSLTVGTQVAGWASTMFMISFFSSMNLSILALIGEYLIRLSSMAFGDRPFIVKETQNIE